MAGFGRIACVAVISAFAAPVLAQPARQSVWRPVEEISHYAVSGRSGMELYTSIGERGPRLGHGGRAIAHTTFKLTWRRDYRPQPDGACKLVSAVPKLVITYTLPRPAARLSGALARRWDAFIAGILAHEKVHGVMIVDMVREIEQASIGLTVAGDPKCALIRQRLTQRLGEISQAQRRRSGEFDRVEMGNGGNVHQLILALVNES